MQDDEGSEPRALVTGDEVAGRGGGSLVRFLPSPDGRVVAYAVVRDGSRWETIAFRDVVSGRNLPDTLAGTHSLSSGLSWLPDGSGLVYERFALPPAGEERTAPLREERILPHVLGEPRERDRLLFAPASADRVLGHGVSEDGRRLLVTSAPPGAVGGAAILQRPRLFAAAILDFPVLDMLRYDRFTGAAHWRSEYGTAEDAEDFRALFAYSPVHNVRPGTCYPATLVAPGERDEVTPPLHAYKFVAALRHAQTYERPILLRVSWGAGHSFGATPEESAENWADQLAFLVRVLGLKGVPGGLR